MIEKMLERYEIQNDDDLLNALKEIFQEIALLGLYRGGFFEKAVFYGGTSLRILYGLDRFSEDLDFSLCDKNMDFDLQDYFGFIEDEFASWGVEVMIRKKEKKITSHIESAFLKNGTSIFDLYCGGVEYLRGKREIKIKLEVDTSPPLGFQTQTKTLLSPITFNIKTMTLPSLYAGKMHALLFRKWKNRIKGRDWYDFEWYVKNNIALDMKHLEIRMREGNDYVGDKLGEEELKDLLLKKIQELDIAQACSEVSVFLKDKRGLEFWSKDYFSFLVSKIRFA